MTQRTCNIIMCCKGNDKFGYLANPVNSIRKYMAHECCCNEKIYTGQALNNIFLKHCVIILMKSKILVMFFGQLEKMVNGMIIYMKRLLLCFLL